MRKEEYTFEVFNQDVHAHLQDNIDHPEFSDFWGSARRFTVEADTEEEAHKKVKRKYPKDKGFVITFT